MPIIAEEGISVVVLVALVLEAQTVWHQVLVLVGQIVQLPVLVPMALVTAVWVLLAVIISMDQHLVRMRCEDVQHLMVWFSA